jgi:hypothetical protein
MLEREWRTTRELGSISKARTDATIGMAIGVDDIDNLPNKAR